jgi:Leucine-rich repeat (LRR) protein
MKTKLLSLLFVLLSFSSFAQTTAIPDLNFEKFLINEGIDSGTPDGVVLTSNINTLTSLSPSGLNITSLVGIQDFVALTSLNCSFNSITALDVSKNVALTRLNCFTNKLTSLDVTSNVNLTSLSCSENKITSLDVSKNLLLTSLDCYTNLLPSIDVSNNTALTSLNCNFNPFTTLDVSKNTALTFLNCNYNQLKTLDVSKNVLLTSLNCNGNTLTSLDISKNTVLTFLDCTANKLTSLNLKNGNNTKFSTFSSFKSNSDLTCILVDSDVYSNANWTTIKDATASYAMDCTVQQYTLIPDVNFEKKLIALGIDYGATDGKVLTSKINTLTSLNVSGNLIADLTGIQDFVALTSLNCSFNQLTSLDVSKNTALTKLSCGNNLITSLDVSNNKLLTEIDCSSNKLISFDIASNTALIYLKCNSNQLINLDTSKNVVLTSLECYGNKLTSIDVSKNDSLLFFRCEYNKLTSIDLTKNISLDRFFCDNNLLTSLDISKNVMLTNMRCSDNKLTSLITKNPLLKTLECYRNSLKTINLSQNTELISLSAGSNSLNNLDLSKNLKLIELSVYRNSLNTLDISKNVLIDNIRCEQNYLINLDVSKNLALKSLSCENNYLTSLDTSNNILLTSISCGGNKLESFDISKNTSLNYLTVGGTNLSELNLKNGNNLKIKSISLLNNRRLTCILVDDETYSNTNWSLFKDNWASFSTDCIPFTIIPDSNFEDKLITLGIDTDGKNGKVLTANISSIKNLDVSNSLILDLTGIQDFIALEILNCKSNKLKRIDLSKNILLQQLVCSSNDLLSLNLKNGNNSKMQNMDSGNFKNNPLLSCIQVDNVAFSNTNWSNAKDTNVAYSTNCSAITNFTLIPDSNFENKLIKLGIDNDGLNGGILTSSISSLKELNLTENPNVQTTPISDITGIQDFISLEKLEVGLNRLSKLDVSKNVLLKELLCFDNQLTSLDLSNNTKLSYLICSDNTISSLDVSKSPNIYLLNCENNQLTNLDVSNNLSLRYFQCQSNKLTNLDVSKNLSLQQLTCSKNQLSKIDVSKNVFLQLLRCGSNMITDSNLSINNSLYQLSCEFNQLITLDLSKNKNIQELDCRSNNLVNLNIRNGNNIKFTTTYNYQLNFTNNPNLTCIQVDDVAYSNANWSTLKDATASYNTTCGEPIVLSSDNFTITSKSESCANQNNGEISITAKQTNTYVAIINGNYYNFINNNLTISDLSPATYKVSILVPGRDFEQIFTVVISKGATITGRSTFNSNKVAVEITEGTAPYAVFVNGTPQFETVAKDFVVEAQKGDLVEVKTAKACEGVFSNQQDGAVLDLLSGYPNPTSGKFEISLATAKKEVNIAVFTLDSQLISNDTYAVANGKVQLNLENQPTGVYLVKVNLDQPAYLKIIKK